MIPWITIKCVYCCDQQTSRNGTVSSSVLSRHVRGLKMLLQAAASLIAILLAESDCV